MNYYGIYKLTNLVNGKMYIGKHVTNNIDDGYMGSGTWLRRAVKKYGISNFRKEWLGFYEDLDELNYMERVFVDQTFVDRADTYNLKVGGEGGSAKGRIVSEDTRRKMSQSRKGKPLHKRGPMSAEERLKRSMANKGQIPWNKGKKYKQKRSLTK